MAVRQNKIKYVYGIGDDLIPMPPLPIVAKRAPTSADFANPGTIWTDTVTQKIYCLAVITANNAAWKQISN